MPDALRPVRHEEIFAGEFVFLFTGVEYGHDGIKGLKYFAPISQHAWQLYITSGSVQLIHNFDATTSRINARQFGTLAAGARSIMRFRFELPLDFGSFPTDAISFVVRRSAAAPTRFEATLLRDGVADPGISAVSVQATLATPTYELKMLTPTGLLYAPGDFLTLDLDSEESAAGQYNELGDLEISYVTARGNVP